MFTTTHRFKYRKLFTTTYPRDDSNENVLQMKKNFQILGKEAVTTLAAMAQGLFASLLIGTIISTLGEQIELPILVEIGNFAKSMAGPAMAIAIAFSLKASPLVVFSSAAVGAAANSLGGAGGPLAVYVIAFVGA